MGDWELLQAYAHQGSENAFQQLVERYVGQVYSVAMREVGDAHRAQDVTQAVFLILVRKAGSLNRATVLSGWLFKATRHVARTALRTEQRRQQREMQAIQDSATHQDDEVVSQIEIHLNDAIESLGEADRNALMLRYFQQRSLPDVAISLGTSQEAAQKRIERAVEKLRRFFGRRGLAVPAVALMSVVSAQAAQPAPPLLIHGIVSLGAPSTPAVSVAAVWLMQGALRRMFLSKILTSWTAALATLLVLPSIGFLAWNAMDHVKVYDVSNDFSLASNPNGVWTYGWQSTLTSTLQVSPMQGKVPSDNRIGIEYWQAVRMGEPTVYHNGTTNVSISDRGRGIFPPGSVWFSSGPVETGRNFGVIRFTAPDAANYELTTSVEPYLNSAMQGDADFHVLRNGTEIFARNLASGESAVHTNTLTLQVGDKLDFIIGRGADDISYASSLKIAIHIRAHTSHL